MSIELILNKNARFLLGVKIHDLVIFTCVLNHHKCYLSAFWNTSQKKALSANALYL